MVAQRRLQRREQPSVTEDGQNVLAYNAVEKPWGPNYMKFDLNLGTDFKGDTAWGMRVDYEKRWLNRPGRRIPQFRCRWAGPNVFIAQFYQPLDAAQRFFVAPSVFASQTLEYLYLKEQQVAQYDTRRVRRLARCRHRVRAPRRNCGSACRGRASTRRRRWASRCRSSKAATIRSPEWRRDCLTTAWTSACSPPTAPVQLTPTLPKPALGADRTYRTVSFDAHDVDQPQGQRLAVRPARRVGPGQQCAVLRPVQGRRPVQFLGLPHCAVGRQGIRAGRHAVPPPGRLSQRDAGQRGLRGGSLEIGQRVQAPRRHARPKAPWRADRCSSRSIPRSARSTWPTAARRADGRCSTCISARRWKCSSAERRRIRRQTTCRSWRAPPAGWRQPDCSLRA